ncbi:hypothetical protein ACXR0O_25185 [Verrucomicrobiota bacterium sgz303538]
MSGPTYNIDDYSAAGPFDEVRHPQEVVYALWGLLERDAEGEFVPDTDLLPPEVFFRDLTSFHSSFMGDGFAYAIDSSGGRSAFFRALRAAGQIGVGECQELLRQAAVVIQAHGIEPPTFTPTWWLEEGEMLSPEVFDRLREQTDALTHAYWRLPVWPQEGCVYLRLLEYMQEHRDELLCRRANPQ